MKIRYPQLPMIAMTGVFVMGCSPVVKVEVPDKPIVVNLQVKIDHTLYVKIQKDVAATIAKNPDLF
jgi:hypothetical protein